MNSTVRMTFDDEQCCVCVIYCVISMLARISRQRPTACERHGLLVEMGSRKEGMLARISDKWPLFCPAWTACRRLAAFERLCASVGLTETAGTRHTSHTQAHEGKRGGQGATSREKATVCQLGRFLFLAHTNNPTCHPSPRRDAWPPAAARGRGGGVLPCVRLDGAPAGELP